MYYINETSGASTPDHPLLSTLALTIAARKRIFEDEERRRQHLGAGVTVPAAPTNPAGRPNQQRYTRSHSPASNLEDDVTPTAAAAAGFRTAANHRIEQELEPSASDAEIFGEFFEAPETAETINLPRGAQSSGSVQPPVFAPLEVEAELDYFLNEPSPPAIVKK